MVQLINELVLNEVIFAEVLENRYGDGSVYAPLNDTGNYYCAREKGFISNEGYITSKGKQLVSKYLC